MRIRPFVARAPYTTESKDVALPFAAGLANGPRDTANVVFAI